MPANSPLLLRLRLRARSSQPNDPGLGVTETRAQWPGERTALVVCDMWDNHWCKSAAARVTELAEPMNQMLVAARAEGIFIIFAPSSVTKFYQDTPQRQLATSAAFVPTPVPLATAERWGTHWCWPDARREGVPPIDDSDMGCSCSGPKCIPGEAWVRQHAGLTLLPGDALTDNGQEVWNLLAARSIDHVLICGVHLNMCVLGRPFAIRQLTYLGKQVALIRDLTDTMYNPERPPGVDHFTGNDLVVEHVEKFWCPSLVSTDLTGQPPFRFKADQRQR